MVTITFEGLSFEEIVPIQATLQGPFIPCLIVFTWSAFTGLSPFESTADDQEVALVGGLHPAVTYTFRIFAINSIDVSSPTDPVVAKTQEEGEGIINSFLALLCQFH